MRRQSEARVGLALSGLLLAFGLAGRIYDYFGPDCFEASENVARVINLTPLAVLTVLVAALVLDLRALRADGRAARWGRWGLSVLALGVIVLVWTFVDALGDLLACAEGD
ncbi:MAG: hypothetical protein ACRDKU_02385 [Gaiellaceae bacterium]